MRTRKHITVIIDLKMKLNSEWVPNYESTRLKRIHYNMIFYESKTTPA